MYNLNIQLNYYRGEIMNIKCFQLGPYETNCYLVWNKKGEATLFDCGGENLKSLYDFVQENNLTLSNLILTHGHGDHIGGIHKFLELFPNATVYIGEEEVEFLTNPTFNLSIGIFGYEITYSGDYKTFKGGDNLFGFEVIDTPGHTVGSKCFYNSENDFLLVGDTLFRYGYGRCDLPTGDISKMKKSLSLLCERFSGNTIIYNAHTEPTTIDNERRFLKMQNML